MAYIDTSAGQAKTRRPLPWLPYRSGSLKDGTAVELIRVQVPEDRSSPATRALLDAMRDLLNYEIVVRGDSYPFPPVALTDDQFLAYYCANELFALVRRDASEHTRKWVDVDNVRYDFGNRLVACFYVKPNYPFRSAHICNAGFLVVPQYQRSRGAGELCARLFVVLADDLGYTGSVFNLVYATNTGSIRLWDKLGFERMSRIPNGGRLKAVPGEGPHGLSEETKFVDAFQFYGDVKRLAPAQRQFLKIVSDTPLHAGPQPAKAKL
jgi:ribosomal protein S18 acetylase RimI-like enzyme